MAIVTFDGSVVLPDFNSNGTAVVSAPFPFTGQLESETTFEVGAAVRFGVVNCSSATTADEAWRVTGATYQFVKKSAATQENAANCTLSRW